MFLLCRVDGENVCLFHRLRIDALVALHMAERRQSVAIDRRALEIEILGSRLHRLGQLRLDRLAAPGEEILGLADPAEAQRLQPGQAVEGEPVVELGDVDVGGP